MPIPETLRSNEVHAGAVIVASGVPTRLSEESQAIVCVTVWNTTDGMLGVGGPELDTDEHLAPGHSYMSRVRDLSMLFVYQKSGVEARVRFTYEV